MSSVRVAPPVIKKYLMGNLQKYIPVFKIFRGIIFEIYAEDPYIKRPLKKEFMKNFSPDNYYHIYLRDKCVVSCISEEGFNETWTTLKAMVGLMKTEYDEDDLSYEMVSKPTMETEEASY